MKQKFLKIFPEADIEKLRKIKVKRKLGVAKLTYKELQKLYEQIFKFAPIGIYTINKKGYIDSFNPKMCELAGAKSPRQVIGLHALTLPTYKKIDLTTHIKKALQQGVAFDLPPVTYFSYTTGKKSIRHFRGVPLKDEKGKVLRLLMLVEDVTERETLKKKLEKYTEQLEKMVQKRTFELAKTVEKLQKRTSELRAALEKLKALDHLKSEFITVVSHQIRSPLSSERWALEMLLNEDLGKLPAEVKDFIGIVYQNNLKLIKILETMIESLTLETKRFVLKKEKIDLVDLVRYCQEKFVAKAQEKNLTFDFQKPEEKIILETDVNKLKRVIEILTSNAVQYSFKNGKITIGLEKEDNLVRFKVTDSGIGIARADLPKIFTKFFRTQKARHYAPDGLGLDLYIAKSHIEVLGGEIGVESEGEGKGSTFFFILPLVQ